MKYKYQGVVKTFLAIFMLAFGLGALESCQKAAKNNKTNILNMKDFGGYDAEWKAIDSLEMTGLFKSALERTEVLATAAKGEKNLEQSIKAAIFRAKYAVMLQEDGIVQAVSVLEGELKNRRGAV